LKKLLTRTEHQLCADKAYSSAEHARFMLVAMAYNIKRGVAVQVGMTAWAG